MGETEVVEFVETDRPAPAESDPTACMLLSVPRHWRPLKADPHRFGSDTGVPEMLPGARDSVFQARTDLSIRLATSDQDWPAHQDRRRLGPAPA